MLTLNKVNPDTTCMVKSVADSPFRAKLADMGLIPGNEVKVLFRAPLGDPIALEVSDYVLSLRNDEASLVEVEEIKGE